MRLRGWVAVPVLILTGAPMLALADSSGELHAPRQYTALRVLEEQARARVTAKARVDLAEQNDGLIDEGDDLEPPHSGRTPNYLRVLAARQGASRDFGHLLKTVLYGGTVEPEVKMGMGLRMTQMNTSPYVAAHLMRLLRSSASGEAMLSKIRRATFETLQPANQLALRYAEELSPDVRGVSDAEFRKVRAYYNDSQIVELTLTVCFFNYFTRLAEGLNLPVETWVLDSPAHPKVPPYSPPFARVALISDQEMAATSQKAALPEDLEKLVKLWGLGFANSMRAMLRCPDIAQAFMAYAHSSRLLEGDMREITLQVAFAVSMANGCRYCSLHEALGLRKVGVSIAKLVAMKKDDSILTPHELAAVQFARKLTRRPASIVDADYQALQGQLGADEALNVLLQTCGFAFLNRFTDGLRLPSEDAAVQNYREIYGTYWK